MSSRMNITGNSGFVQKPLGCLEYWTQNNILILVTESVLHPSSYFKKIMEVLNIFGTTHAMFAEAGQKLWNRWVEQRW